MINIPVQAHFLTLTIGTPEIVEHQVQRGRQSYTQRERVIRTQEFPPRRTASSLALSMAAVNRMFAAADVFFQLFGSTTDSVEAPNGRAALDDPGFLMLARQFPATRGVSLLLVGRFQGSEGGAAVESQAVCAVGDAAPDSSLAHEFGHLLGLNHQGDIRDMMNPGLSVPSPQLTSAEIATIRNGRLVARFRGKP